mmetsp:Transcript_55152/g.156943  ORF Transcript_55152/g.156943 Transcript_55152/m.156943 type:complete len:212 (-) Transcript_55152:7-642(-)
MYAWPPLPALAISSSFSSTVGSSSGSSHVSGAKPRRRGQSGAAWRRTRQKVTFSHRSVMPGKWFTRLPGWSRRSFACSFWRSTGTTQWSSQSSSLGSSTVSRPRQLASAFRYSDLALTLPRVEMFARAARTPAVELAAVDGVGDVRWEPDFSDAPRAARCGVCGCSDSTSSAGTLVARRGAQAVEDARASARLQHGTTIWGGRPLSAPPPA